MAQVSGSGFGPGFGSGGGFTNPFTNIKGLNQRYLDETPTAGYGAYMGGWGGGGYNPFTKWMGQQQPRYERDWMGELASDPTLTWTNYLLKQKPYAEWMSQEPSARGINPSNWGGRTQWRWF